MKLKSNDELITVEEKDLQDYIECQVRFKSKSKTGFMTFKLDINEELGGQAKQMIGVGGLNALFKGELLDMKQKVYESAL